MLDRKGGEAEQARAARLAEVGGRFQPALVNQSNPSVIRSVTSDSRPKRSREPAGAGRPSITAASGVVVVAKVLLSEGRRPAPLAVTLI